MSILDLPGYMVVQASQPRRCLLATIPPQFAQLADFAPDFQLYLRSCVSGSVDQLLSEWKNIKSAIVNLYPAKLIYSNFQPLQVVSRYRDPQPQVVEYYL